MEIMEMLDKLEARIRAAEADRDTARAGEAWAVEALRRIAEPPQCGCRPICQCRTLEARSIELDAKIDIATEVIDSDQPALDWLDQQRRDAAADWLEKEAQTNMKQIGEYYERSAAGMLKQAAELRKGKGE